MGMFDGIKKALGFAEEPQPDRNDVRDARMEMTRRSIPGFFAAQLSEEVASLPDREIRRVVPDIARDVEGPIPTNENARILHVAKGIEAFAEKAVRDGRSSPLGPDLGAAVTERALKDIATPRIRAEDFAGRSLADMVAQKRDGVERNTLNYLGAGALNERGVTEAAEHFRTRESYEAGESTRTLRQSVNGMERNYPSSVDPKTSSRTQETAELRDMLSTQIAMSRAGVFDPTSVIRFANDRSVVHGMEKHGVGERHEGEPEMTRIVPAYRSNGLSREMSIRSPEVIREVARSRSTPEQPLPEVRGGPVAAPIKGEPQVVRGVKRDLGAAVAAQAAAMAR